MLRIIRARKRLYRKCLLDLSGKEGVVRTFSAKSGHETLRDMKRIFVMQRPYRVGIRGKELMISAYGMDLIFNYHQMSNSLIRQKTAEFGTFKSLPNKFTEITSQKA